jgi:hypothetical protein
MGTERDENSTVGRVQSVERKCVRGRGKGREAEKDRVTEGADALFEHGKQREARR